MAIELTLITFVSTLLGGLLAFRYRDRLHLILGFTAGVLLGVVVFEIFPEIIQMIHDTGLNPRLPMIALLAGFLVFHILEKLVLVHQGHEGRWGEHKHPTVGLFSAIALCGHSFLDGVGIGLAFQISHTVGLLVALAVIAHDFSDGLNTVSLMLVHKNTDTKAGVLLAIDALAPILGALSTLIFTFSDKVLLLYLGFFAGFLLYISTSDILPEAHSKHSSRITIGLTILGTIFIFLVTKFI